MYLQKRLWASLGAITLWAGVGFSADGTWTNKVAGTVYDWFDTACWANSTPAHGANAIATFPNILTVTNRLNDNVTLGGLSCAFRTALIVLSDGTHRISIENTTGTAVFLNDPDHRQNFEVYPPMVLKSTNLRISKNVTSNSKSTVSVAGGISGTGDVELWLKTANTGSYPVLMVVTNVPLTFTGSLSLLCGNASADVKSWFEIWTANSFSGGTVISNADVRAYSAGAFSEGTVVVKDGTRLALTKSNVLQRKTNLFIFTDGVMPKIDLGAAGTTSIIGDLYIDGVRQPTGIYTSTTHPTYFTGLGTLEVKGPLSSVVFVN